MNDSWANYYNRQTTSDEHLLCAHLLECVEVESPSALIERFRSLFIDGVGYPNLQVRYAVERIITSKLAEREFKFLLNRSCYILINQWQMQPRFHAAIPQLIALFETPPSRSASHRTTQRLRELVQNFTKTEQYLTLRRLAQVTIQKPEEEANATDKPLLTLIRRYPYLYEHCLLANDSTDQQRQKVRLIREKQQQQLEINLSEYITYQRLQQHRNSLGFTADKQHSLTEHTEVRTAKNPTLLSDRKLDIALKQFVGKVNGSDTHRDLAKQFLTYSSTTRSYRTFKEELYEYLTASIDTSYGRNQFNQQLYKHLQNILSQNNSYKLSEVLLVGTCKKLLDYLIVESGQESKHYVFSDLTSNIGITPTIGLILKIVLLCRKVKPYLEKRFSILFNHYEAYTRDNVDWLVESLENLNVALSTHFGATKFCY